MVRDLNYHSEFHFGKHQGMPVAEIIETDPAYIAWLVKNEVVRFDEKTLRILRAKGIA